MRSTSTLFLGLLAAALAAGCTSPATPADARSGADGAGSELAPEASSDVTATTDGSTDVNATEVLDLDAVPPAEAGECAAGQTRSCYSGASGTRGVGACRAGTESCGSEGRWSGVCAGEVLPETTEVCGNGVDDNCDGTIDERCCPFRDVSSVTGTSIARGTIVSTVSLQMGSCGGAGPEETLRWTAPSAGTFEFRTTGSTFDTVLYLRDGSCTGAELGCNDDVSTGITSSVVRATLRAGQVVVIVIDGYNGMVGNYSLSVLPVPATPCMPGATRACYSGPAATQGVGACHGGMQLCDATGNWPAACAGEVAPAAAEICDNTLDDNCNGVADEGCGACTPGATRDCYSGAAGTQGVGACRAGTQSCDATRSWQALCAGEVVPAAAEVCGNGADDNCNGMVDEGCGVCVPGATRSCYSGAAATRNVGLCRAGTQTCDATGNWPTACAGEVLPAAMETCGNGLDDNCSGTADEGCGVCMPGATRSCYSGAAGTQGVGACRAGTQSCDATGNWPTACAGQVVPAAMEACGNGLDDNCDGVIDEACPSVATQLAAGDGHACAVRTDTQLSCWGSNSSGQLGDGTTTNRNRPALVPGLAGVQQVALGSQHTCALLADATVRCWGSNLYGQLGDGTTTARSVPTRVPGLAGVAQLTAGYNFTCARLVDGTARCWGANNYGQLGDGTMVNRLAPATVTGLANVVELRAGGVFANAHACARRMDGSVLCWGHNALSTLGDGTTTDHATPTLVAGLSNVAQLAVGYSVSCAVLLDNTLRCWGNNAYYQFGDGVVATRNAPYAVPGVSNVAELSLGESHTCARMVDGTVRCWGTNGAGQVGDGTVTTAPTPVVVPGLSGIAQVAAGNGFSCARTTAGGLRCWGSDSVGQVGDGVPPRSLATVPAQGLSTAASIAAGGARSCARRTDNTLACWGHSDDVLDSAPTFLRAVPTTVSGVTTVAEIAMGRWHTCVRLAGGTVQCLGLNLDGQLGDGTTISRMTAATTGLAGVLQVASGDAHSCAVVTGGTLQCWGSNTYGQLGDGTTTARNRPTAVPGLTGVVEVAAGSGHTCARLTGGAVRCWGRNFVGQLGNGTTTDSLAFVTPGVSGVLELDAGGSHTCARTATGVLCWGTTNGAAPGYVTSPAAVVGLATATQVAAGASHTCARLADGTARCWGANAEGQLGDGTQSNSGPSVGVVGLANVVEVAGGESHSCARLADNSVRCWGNDFYGQLGDGQLGIRRAPVALTW